ncbi:MAG: exodeoxyribonuclease III [Candidatus Marinimicrobia bacterium]|nr:exodeoxyribonuclease III [Candidatus Neomarinimicrobiota bacterium]MBL7023159.1 exodeoxyribonuclease III [Candidatus Neomarinimicrobiota bacterium]MBL7109033.1 exodeoxyribonuclease III [Candidatus Neomarinimicrobiota bacterium]
MRMISWNVNGIRAVLKKGFMDFFNFIDADIFCIQEIKAMKEQVDFEFPPDYHQYWNSAVRKGYSGTLVFSKAKPLDVVYGIGIDKHDNEGRVITLEFPQYFFVTVYTPNSKRGLERLDYRTQEWDTDFLEYVKSLEKSKPVVFCGDLNVAHKEIDLTNPKSNKHNAGFTNEERHSFDNIVKAGFIDTFREFTEDSGHYTWWSYMHNSRAKNIGWRIDYFCISELLKPYLTIANIYPEIMGSDHCPIGIEMDFDDI